ncbi:hypothetical protein [Cytobacillus sp. IB215316]|uniref:hypothetical protein n=1 Tax=Cytobacillus sp. IB215316 TaxID=3097354 RepID=UPI002A0F0A42|nr:hypothetical protein [Cytobacillus sp. IB215316]MDX8360661.1 hypothetical protein [Cytobacillus sp. IB215316]
MKKKATVIVGILLLFITIYVIYNSFFSKTASIKSEIGAEKLEYIGIVESDLFDERPHQEGYLKDNSEFIIYNKGKNNYYIVKSGENLIDTDIQYTQTYILPLFNTYDDTSIESKHLIIKFENGLKVDSTYFYKVIHSKGEDKFLSFFFNENTFFNTFQDGYKKLVDY